MNRPLCCLALIFSIALVLVSGCKGTHGGALGTGIGETEAGYRARVRAEYEALTEKEAAERAAATKAADTQKAASELSTQKAEAAISAKTEKTPEPAAQAKAPEVKSEKTAEAISAKAEATTPPLVKKAAAQPTPKAGPFEVLLNGRNVTVCRCGENPCGKTGWVMKTEKGWYHLFPREVEQLGSQLFEPEEPEPTPAQRAQGPSTSSSGLKEINNKVFSFKHAEGQALDAYVVELFRLPEGIGGEVGLNAEPNWDKLQVLGPYRKVWISGLPNGRFRFVFARRKDSNDSRDRWIFPRILDIPESRGVVTCLPGSGDATYTVEVQDGNVSPAPCECGECTRCQQEATRTRGAR